MSALRPVADNTETAQKQTSDGRSHIKVRDRGDMVYLRLQGNTRRARVWWTGWHWQI